MKKLILAILTCAFIASPAFADDFEGEQTNMLNNITMQMERFKDDARKMEFLTQKKACVEEATKLLGLQECMSKFDPAQLEIMTNY
jgi:hypothetical protein